MTNKNCLNCDKELTDKFCSGCGQEADTHRISFKNFIFHDVMHGTFHIDKGMLFTARQSLMRPGKAALDYISGKRKRYYNVFYLTLITIGLIIFLRHFYGQLIGQEETLTPDPFVQDKASKAFDEILVQKSKILILLFVPFSALSSCIIFRRKKLYLSEHFIIAGMILLGILLISAAGHLFFYFNFIIPFNDTFADAFSIFIPALIIFHIGYGYFNAFSNDYSHLGIAYRILLFFILTSLEILILFYIIFGFVTDWKFGTIHFSF